METTISLNLRLAQCTSRTKKIVYRFENVIIKVLCVMYAASQLLGFVKDEAYELLYVPP